MVELALYQGGEQTIPGVEVTVRPMRPEEKPMVRRIAFRAFSLLARLFFSWGDGVLVAEHAGRLVGGVVLSTFALTRDHKVGYVEWIFTDPDSRGLGVGQRLVEAALAHLAAESCDEVIAAVEGHNTSSSKLFATRGFGVLSPGAQWQRYGWRLPLVWWRALRFFDVGHLFWAKPAPAKDDNPSAQWWGTLVANALVVGVASARWIRASWVLWAAVPAVILMLLGVRLAGMWLVARAQGLEVRYRAWESGFPLSLALVLAFGWPYVVPGGLYPKGHNWRYRELLHKLGWMALAGVAGPLALLWLARGLAWLPAVAAVLPLLYHVGISLLMVDVLVPFFPLACYNGRRLWDWSPVTWAVVTALVVALMVVPR